MTTKAASVKQHVHNALAVAEPMFCSLLNKVYCCTDCAWGIVLAKAVGANFVVTLQEQHAPLKVIKQLVIRQRNNSSSSSDVTATTCFGHTTIIKRDTVVYCLKLFA
jgi:hypothetical protein